MTLPEFPSALLALERARVEYERHNGTRRRNKVIEDLRTTRLKKETEYATEWSMWVHMAEMYIEERWPGVKV